MIQTSTTRAPLPKLPKSRRSGAFLIPIVDLLSLFTAFLAGLGVLILRPEFGDFHAWWQSGGIHQFYSFSIFALIAVQTFWISGQYLRRKPFWSETGEITRMLLAWALLNGVLVLLAKWPFSRTVWLVSWGLSLFFVPIGRVILKQFLLKIGRWQRPTLILGDGERAENARDALMSESLLGFTVLGSLRLIDNENQDNTPADKKQLAVFYAHYDELLNWITKNPRTHIVIALDDAALKRHENFISKLCFQMPSIHFAPSTSGLPLASMEGEHFFSHDVLLLRSRNILLNPYALAFKRLTDIVGALILLILLAPFFALMYVLIRQDGGSAFFGQSRIGRNGNIFTCYKFRSMAQNADQLLNEILQNDTEKRQEYEQFRKLKDDPRITKIGHFLRKTSLDELPQLWNVLRGEMSLVGPRPILPNEAPLFGEQLPYYLETRPGMTGLWQVSGRNRLTFAKRVEMDVWYVRNWSLWYDLAILFKTIRVVLKRDGAY